MTEVLRSTQEIPSEFRSIFSDYAYFNRVQSETFNDIFNSSCSVVVTAPTGSGKTVLFELAIIKLLMEVADRRTVKAVYVAPVKALCSERYQDWRLRLAPVGVSCIEITGDSVDHVDMEDYQLILTTPEKWDSLTRRWRDNLSLVQCVKLFMIDEVHLLNDKNRGPTLETIVCRMKTVMKIFKDKLPLRFIAVSATIFNIDDLAYWLGNKNKKSAKFYRFGNHTRPVKLKRVVKGYPQSKQQSPYLFDLQLSYKLKPLITEYSEGKPVLIFCSTRRSVVQTCKVLVEQLLFRLTAEQTTVLNQVADQLLDCKLREYIRAGIGYHHAGLGPEDRILLQEAFSCGSLPVLVATSTLAMGVNLPAHLVIIKSTQQFIAGRTVEYQESSVLQMLGRAGRPQFDTSATAVIMTRADLVGKYQSLMDCKEILESNLHLHLAEHLNSEIVLFTITDLAVAMDWLRGTFLYQRAFKNPHYYGLSTGSPSKIEKDLEIMLLKEINALKRAGLIELSENGLDVSPTPDGRLTSHYYISLHTFELFSNVKFTATIQSLLELLSQAHELNEVQLRVSERRLLNDINSGKYKDKIRFPISGKIKTREMKVNCLTQACLGCLIIPDPPLQQETQRLVNVLQRVAHALAEFLTRRRAYCALLSATILAKCLHARLWENSPYVARQLQRIGAALGATLAVQGKNSFEALLASHPHELEAILNRGPPMGRSIIEQVRHLPHYNLLVHINRVSVLSAQVQVSIEIVNIEQVSQHSTAGANHTVRVIIGDSSNRLLHERRVPDTSLLRGTLTFIVTIPLPLPQKVFAHVVSEQWVGVDITHDIVVNPMIDSVIGTNCYLPVSDTPFKKIAKKSKKNYDDTSNKCFNIGSPLGSEVTETLWSCTDKHQNIVNNIMADSTMNRTCPKLFAEEILKNQGYDCLQFENLTYLPPSRSYDIKTNEKSLSLKPAILAPGCKNLCCFDIEPDWEALELGLHSQPNKLPDFVNKTTLNMTPDKKQFILPIENWNFESCANTSEESTYNLMESQRQEHFLPPNNYSFKRIKLTEIEPVKFSSHSLKASVSNFHFNKADEANDICSFESIESSIEHCVTAYREQRAHNDLVNSKDVKGEVKDVVYNVLPKQLRTYLTQDLDRQHCSAISSGILSHLRQFPTGAPFNNNDLSITSLYKNSQLSLNFKKSKDYVFSSLPTLKADDDQTLKCPIKKDNQTPACRSLKQSLAVFKATKNSSN